MKWTITLARGSRLTVVQHNDGSRDVYLHRRPHDEDPAFVLQLRDDEARQLGALLTGAYERPRIVEELEATLGDFQIEQIRVPAGQLGQRPEAGGLRVPQTDGRDGDLDPARARVRRGSPTRRRHSRRRHNRRRRPSRPIPDRPTPPHPRPRNRRRTRKRRPKAATRCSPIGDGSDSRPFVLCSEISKTVTGAAPRGLKSPPFSLTAPRFGQPVARALFSAAAVSGPTLPSTERPFACWNATTAASVCSPKCPSARPGS